MPSVRFWHKADIGLCDALSAFGDKADMTVRGVLSLLVAMGARM